jgi:hypothetical protein
VSPVREESEGAISSGALTRGCCDRRLTPDEQAQHRLRRETINPWVKAEPVRVDVWVMPWSDRADLMLQLQLAYMLSRDDFWTKHSFLRVCGVVGDFGRASGDPVRYQQHLLTSSVAPRPLHNILLYPTIDYSAGKSCELQEMASRTPMGVEETRGVTSKQRHKELYDEVWREWRPHRCHRWHRVKPRI